MMLRQAVSAITGRFVSKKHAADNPSTTYARDADRDMMDRAWMDAEILHSEAIEAARQLVNVRPRSDERIEMVSSAAFRRLKATLDAL